MCVSERFRKQFRYVVFDMHLNRCGTLRQNGVAPETGSMPKEPIQHVIVDDTDLV